MKRAYPRSQPRESPRAGTSRNGFRSDRRSRTTRGSCCWASHRRSGPRDRCSAWSPFRRLRHRRPSPRSTGLRPIRTPRDSSVRLRPDRHRHRCGDCRRAHCPRSDRSRRFYICIPIRRSFRPRRCPAARGLVRRSGTPPLRALRPRRCRDCTDWFPSQALPSPSAHPRPSRRCFWAGTRCSPPGNCLAH